MKVLYTCIRAQPHHLSTAYAADQIVRDMTERLCAAFDYAMLHWNTVGNDWFRLFDDADADKDVYNKLMGSTEPKKQARKTEDNRTL